MEGLAATTSGVNTMKRYSRKIYLVSLVEASTSTPLIAFTTAELARNYIEEKTKANKELVFYTEELVLRGWKE